MKSFYSILIYLLVLCASTSTKAASPSPDNCDYYLDKEKETGCFVRDQKDSDYLVKYGYRYCSIFKSRLTDWKDARKDWVKKNHSIKDSHCLGIALKVTPMTKSSSTDRQYKFYFRKVIRKMLQSPNWI